MKLLVPEEVDETLRWTLGRAERLARRGDLPHVVLADGSIRFRPADVRAAVKVQQPAPPMKCDGCQRVLRHGAIRRSEIVEGADSLLIYCSTCKGARHVER